MTLKERRLAAGLKQSDVAQALNVDQGAVSNWERGVNLPVRKYREALARFFGCTEQELLDGAKQKEE